MTQRGDEIYRALHASYAFVVLGAGLEPVRYVVRRGLDLVNVQGFEEAAPYGRHADVRAEELVGRAGEYVGAYGVAVYRDVGSGVHGVNRDERAGPMRPLRYRGHVVDR